MWRPVNTLIFPSCILIPININQQIAILSTTTTTTITIITIKTKNNNNKNNNNNNNNDAVAVFAAAASSSSSSSSSALPRRPPLPPRHPLLRRRRQTPATAVDAGGEGSATLGVAALLRQQSGGRWTMQASLPFSTFDIFERILTFRSPNPYY